MSFADRNIRDKEREGTVDAFKVAIAANGNLNAVQKEALNAIAEKRRDPKDISNTVKYRTAVQYLEKCIFSREDATAQEISFGEEKFTEVLVEFDVYIRKNSDVTMREIEHWLEENVGGGNVLGPGKARRR